MKMLRPPAAIRLVGTSALVGWVVFVAFILLGIVSGYLHAQSPADSAAAVAIVPPSAAINWLGAGIVGAVAALGTGGVSWVAKGADKLAGNADGFIRDKAGPAFPLLTMGLAAAAIPLASKLGAHITVNDVNLFQAAPAAAIVGITLRESGRKWVVPLLAKLFGQGRA